MLRHRARLAPGRRGEVEDHGDVFVTGRSVALYEWCTSCVRTKRGGAAARDCDPAEAT